MGKVNDALHCKCPKCSEGNIFSTRGNLLRFRMAKMDVHCKECNYKFELEPGFFFGAMYVSYALVIAQIVACMILFFYILEWSPIMSFSIVTLIIILMSNLNFKISRSIWIYMFYKNS